MFGKYQESMCESLRNKELFLVLCGENNSEPFAVSLRSFTKVHCNVKYLTVYYTYQFILRIIDLEMKSTENPFMGAGLIILYEFHINSCFFEIIVVISFHKVASCISEDCWLYYF